MARSPTEERVDLERYEDDTQRHTLPGMRPARSPSQARHEREIYVGLRKAWRATAALIWDILELPGRARAMAADLGPFVNWTPRQQAEFGRAVEHLKTAIVGPARDPSAFAVPSNAHLDISNPVWQGKPILPGQLRTAYTTGAGDAAQLLGPDAPALMGIRSEAAIEDLLKQSFVRLSDGARLRIGDALDAQGYPGGSVRDVIETGLREGDNPLQVARALRSRFAEIDGYQWPRLARTETSFALNHAAHDAYEEAGYRDITREDGTAMEYAPYHPNCFPAGTMVEAPGVCGGLRMHYAGPLCQLVFADGGDLTVTVNHPLLTPRGFVPAGQLRVGDDVVKRRHFERVHLADPDVEGRPTGIDEVFVALCEARGMTARAMPVAAEDVHGDAQFGHGDVCVVTPDGLLGDAGEALCLQHLNGDGLGAAGDVALGLNGGGNLTAMFVRLALATDSRMSRPDHPLSRGSVHLVGDKLLGFRLRADSDSVFSEAAADGAATDTESLAQAIDAFAGAVTPCKIVKVRRIPFDGHVYDLQTFGSLYTANGVLASNCVCGQTIDPATGRIVPDVAATACELCQAALAEANILTAVGG